MHMYNTGTRRNGMEEKNGKLSEMEAQKLKKSTS